MENIPLVWTLCIAIFNVTSERLISGHLHKIKLRKLSKI